MAQREEDEFYEFGGNNKGEGDSDEESQEDEKETKS